MTMPPHPGVRPLRQLCFEGPAERVEPDETHTQPALLAVSSAAALESLLNQQVPTSGGRRA